MTESEKRYAELEALDTDILEPGVQPGIDDQQAYDDGWDAAARTRWMWLVAGLILGCAIGWALAYILQ